MKKHFKFYCIAMIVFLFATNSSHSQQVLAPAGTTFTNTNFQFSFTIGEILIETYTDTNKILTQGFHQTKLSSISIHENPDLGYNILCFPNPTVELLTIETTIQNFENTTYQLYDLSGKVLELGKIKNQITSVSFANFPASSYYIAIFQDDKLLKIFKIIKQF